MNIENECHAEFWSQHDIWSAFQSSVDFSLWFMHFWYSVSSTIVRAPLRVQPKTFKPDFIMTGPGINRTKKSPIQSNKADIQKILPADELIIFTKFQNNWVKIVDFPLMANL